MTKEARLLPRDAVEKHILQLDQENVGDCFCRVVCNAIGRRESSVCIAFVLGIIVTTPDVHVSGIVPALRKRFSDSYICGLKISEDLLKNFAQKPSSPGEPLLFNLLRPSCTMSGGRCLNRSRPALRSRCSTPNALR